MISALLLLPLLLLFLLERIFSFLCCFSSCSFSGVAEKKEVIQYMDPKHQHWAREEAAMLVGPRRQEAGGRRQEAGDRRCVPQVSLADRDSDQLLTLEEMLAQPLPFLTSKLVSPDRSFHGQL